MMSESERIEVTPNLLVALIEAAVSGDTGRFLSLMMQTAANTSRRGHGEVARSLRDAIDAARMKDVLPAYSGLSARCPKCTHEGEMATLYIRENGREFLSRSCPHCGYTNYEKCADAEDGNG